MSRVKSMGERDALSIGESSGVRTRAGLVISASVSSLGGFLFGYDNIVISGAIGHLSKYFQLQPAGVGWAVGCALIGCLLGSATAGGIADKFGLKRALYACAACFALSSFGVWGAGSFVQYVAWRIVGGVGIGAASIVAPMYIAEIAPAKVRGRLVVLYQLGIVVGILCAVFINMLIEKSGAESWQLARGWRWMFAVAAVPAIIFAVTIAFANESPRWLMKVGRREQAIRVLTSINGETVAQPEAASIQRSLSQEEGGLKELFEGPFRRALIIGFLLAAFSQTSGITCLLSFLPEIFKSAGQNASDAFFQSVLVGVVNLAFTIVAIQLVDRTGRKTLILFGTLLQTLSLATVGFVYLIQGQGNGILAGIMAFVAGHAVGNGAVCWVIISEIFPTKVRGAAMSIATTALWIFAYLADQFFPVLRAHLGSHGTFFIFAAMAAINFVFVLLLVPETKGYSLEEISRIWMPRS
ncbi:MAG TPA: sugar porter family MFS transporter [Bryobacteraceae bacterium]|nr:sugar porter family MFS transporter [Bryobacteraceae bacterium]